MNFIQKWWLLKEPVFLWFVRVIRKRGDDIKLISIARWIGIKNTNVLGKLFSFDRVSDDPIDIKLVKIKLAMTIVESFFNDFVIGAILKRELCQMK